MGSSETDLRKLLIQSFDQLVESVELLYENEVVDLSDMDKISSNMQQFNDQFAVYKYFSAQKQNEEITLQELPVPEPESVESIEENSETDLIEAVTELEAVQSEKEYHPSMAVIPQEPELEAPIEPVEDQVQPEQNISAEEGVEEPGKQESEIQIEPEPIELKEEVLEETIAEEAVEPVELKEEVLEETIAEEAVEPVVEDEPVSEEPIVRVDYSEPIDSAELNDQHKQEDDSSLASKLKKQAIPDLKAAIGLNQRFLFSNALFEGNMEAFNRVINEINHLESKEMADTFLRVQIIDKYQWDEESEEVLAFFELVERRFM